MSEIKVDSSTLHMGRWYEYLTRFVLGGLATVITGVVAKEFGPVVGGLFLAFPAILPASATLLQTHEMKKKQQAGLSGISRGKKAAALDAAGAAMGSFGLMGFAVVAWILLPKWPESAALVFATVVWFGVAVLVWRQRKLRTRLLTARQPAVSQRR